MDAAWRDPDHTRGHRLGQTVDLPGFTLNGSNGGVAVSVVATAGKASVAANGKITRSFSGTYQASSGPSCNAANHQLEMSRCSIVCSGNICSCVS